MIKKLALLTAVTIFFVFLAACEQNGTEADSDISAPENSDLSGTESIKRIFGEDKYVKIADMSDEPGFESILKFMADGTFEYSLNVLYGFLSDTLFPERPEYYLLEYGNGDFVIKHEEDILLSMLGNELIGGSFNDSAAEFITKREYEEIFDFHTEKNKEFEGAEDY